MVYLMKLTAELLEQFAKVLEKYDLAEMRYEEEDCELHVIRKIESSVSFQTPMMQAAPQVSSTGTQGPQVTQAHVAPVVSAVDTNLEEVKAPIVGTAYLSPEPGAPAFIKVGDHIKKDQPIMIIEAMKVMNQLKSPVSGTIKNIFVTNAKPVEFGDVLIIIQKD
jgi:acetyl-CoA carboxylase biotin carboxyl carrier protein